MLRRSTIQLLRFHFSFFLLPVYLFALSQLPVIHIRNAILTFIILHLLVYPASNGYNSYMDRDESPIGGLEKPLQPTRQLFVITVIMDTLAIMLSLLVSGLFALGILLYILASRAYSYRGIRLKKYPVLGFLTVFICQGALIFILVYRGVGVDAAGGASVMGKKLVNKSVVSGNGSDTQLVIGGLVSRRLINGGAASSRTTSDESANEGLTDKRSTNERSTNGGVTSERSTNAGATNEEATKGETTNEGATKRLVANESAINGASTNGEAANEGMTDDRLTNGGATNGGTIDGRLINKAVTSDGVEGVTNGGVYEGSLNNRGWLQQTILGVPLLLALTASLLIGALYPLTQVYQHDADKKDGITTISYLLGKRGSFIFSGLLFLAATLCLYLRFYQQDALPLFYRFLLIMFPVVLFFLYWMVKVWKNGDAADFNHSLKMNIVSTLCTTAFFITLIITLH